MIGPGFDKNTLFYTFTSSRSERKQCPIYHLGIFSIDSNKYEYRESLIFSGTWPDYELWCKCSTTSLTDRIKCKPLRWNFFLSDWNVWEKEQPTKHLVALRKTKNPIQHTNCWTERKFRKFSKGGENWDPLPLNERNTCSCKKISIIHFPNWTRGIKLCTHFRVRDVFTTLLSYQYVFNALTATERIKTQWFSNIRHLP